MPVDGAFARLTIADGTARAAVRPEHAHRLCEGHFPGDPILPGAYLAGLMAELAARAVAAAGEALVLVAVERCVFLSRVTPEHEILVTARPCPGARVEAEVHTRGACAARAVLRFGPCR